MGLFDHMIEKGKEPRTDINYIVMMDLPASVLYETPFVEKGTIVKDVKIRTNQDGNIHLGYDFEMVETGEKCHTNYSWVLAKHTPDNMLKLSIFEGIKAQLEKLEKECENARFSVETLAFKNKEIIEKD
jgi:hypothetical protein